MHFVENKVGHKSCVILCYTTYIQKIYNSKIYYKNYILYLAKYKHTQVFQVFLIDDGNKCLFLY